MADQPTAFRRPEKRWHRYRPVLNETEPRVPGVGATSYGHGSHQRGPDPWTAIPNTPDTTFTQRRRAAIHAAECTLMMGGTADDLATYLPMLFTEAELDEMRP